ncbi:MAG: hypothetical protein ABIU05_05840 [Nitrospirales bacterium]
MDHDPDFEELIRVCDGLTNAQIVKVDEDTAIIVLFFRQKRTHPYGEVDNLAASLAFSTLPSLGEPPHTAGRGEEG